MEEATRVLSVSRHQIKEDYSVCHGVEKHNQILTKIFERENVDETQVVNMSECKQKLAAFLSHLKNKLDISRRKKRSFDELFADWLAKDPLELNVRILNPPSTSSQAPSSERGPGRPTLEFHEVKDRVKKRKVQSLLQHGTEKLLLAGQISLHASGDRLGAKIVKNVFERASSPAMGPPASPGMASSSASGRSPSPAMGPSASLGTASSSVSRRSPSPAIGRPSSAMSWGSTDSGRPPICTNPRTATPEEALALFVDSKLTKSSYNWTRKFSRNLGHGLLPSYHVLQKAKQACCPPRDQLTITESRAETPLQTVLDHTGQRLCISQTHKFTEFIAQDCKEFILLCKWGFDGSHASQYRQKLGASQRSDKTMILFSFVPIELRAATGMCVWRNPAPGSPRLCRPFKILFEEETIECIVEEANSIATQIDALSPFKVMIGNSEITVRHQLVLTMVDGKVINALTGTKSTHRCFICGCTQAELEHLTSPPPDNIENYKFGLQTLHAWIRLFEFLLNIAYKRDIDEAGSSGETPADNKKKRIERLRANKKKIQDGFWDKLSLRVDQPKPGFGNTNDGNTARTFFRQKTVSAAITGIDARLIGRFGAILSALSSKSRIDAEKFANYAAETKSLLNELHPGYRLTPTVHKILDHGANVIKYYQTLSIGSLTEEPQEARHKECRRFRLQNTRKTSRRDNTSDLFAMLFVSSDPIVNLHRKPEETRQRRLEVDREVEALLIPDSGICDSMKGLSLDSRSSSEFSELDFSDEDSPVNLTPEEQDSN